MPPEVLQRDWQQQRCSLRVNDEQAQQWVGSHSLGDPCWLLPAWLQHVAAEYGSVPAGTVDGWFGKKGKLAAAVATGSTAPRPMDMTKNRISIVMKSGEAPKAKTIKAASAATRPASGKTR